MNTNTNGQGWSTRLTYGNGPFNVLFDYTVINGADLGAATGRTKNSGTKLGAGWAYQPGSQIALIWNQHKNDNIAAAIGTIANAGDDLKQSTWTLNWEHTFGNAQVFAQYAKGNSVSGMTGATTGDSTVKQWLIGARYNLSKRTAVYASYNAINNGDLQYADYVGGGYTSANTLAVANRGADPRVTAVGIIHNF